MFGINQGTGFTGLLCLRADYFNVSAVLPEDSGPKISNNTTHW